MEIALGPKGAFKNGNIGALTRRVPASQVVTAVTETAVTERQRRTKRRKPPREPRTPPVVETLRRAIAWQQELNAGKVASQADIARREGLTRARVTQVLMLLRLAPEIQERILNMPKTVNPPRISERGLRPIARIENHHEQAVAFSTLIEIWTPAQMKQHLADVDLLAKRHSL